MAYATEGTQTRKLATMWLANTFTGLKPEDVRDTHQVAVECELVVQDLICLNLNVCGLALGATQGLMDHDARVGQAVALALQAQKCHKAGGHVCVALCEVVGGCIPYSCLGAWSMNA